ncbi:hypothetical protein AXF42_Ash010911 [Apostasia shenzhenica]|uniref:Uncharacterized protein n=1 Tax=Apostasia shenzhenica TaxID=1088818 RepID=A0A2H9ZQJ7_9ASPA|nr:hypothetical protein AXF42_Ash010911 [Apostasia shenzhenica]
MEDLVWDIKNNLSEAPEQFEELLEEAKSLLYSSCKSFTKLSVLMHLFNLKAANGLSNKCFTELLILIKDMLPAHNQLPNSTYEAKKTLCKLGMHYEKINACPNDCILYRNEFSNLEQCPECGKSRWKLCANGVKEKYGIPEKVLWYLPPIPRIVSILKSMA